MLTFLFGLCASISLVAMSLSISRKRILILSLAINIFNGLQYLLLGQPGAFAMAAVGFVMAVTVLTSLKVPALGSWKVLAFFLTAYPVTFLFANGIPTSAVEVLPLFSTMIATSAVFVSNPMLMKAMFAANGASWLIFEISTGAWGAVPGEILTLAGNLTALGLLFAAARRGEPLNEVKEINVRVMEFIAARRASKRRSTDSYAPVIGVRELSDVPSETKLLTSV